MLFGAQIQLLVGPTVAIPATPDLLEALRNIEITHSEQGRSGFQITFQLGRSGPLAMLDYPLLSNPLLRPFHRVIVTLVMNLVPTVLIDGLITHVQMQPGREPGSGTLTVTGEDVGVAMDREEKTVEHPAQPEPIIAAKVIATYAQYGLIPMVIPPPVMDVPVPLERVPVQRGTDYAYLVAIAERVGYVFFIEPGPAPFTNVAYWGPPRRVGIPQRALSVNLGPATNVESISFQQDARAAAVVAGRVQDARTGVALPVMTFASVRPPLAAFPALPLGLATARRVQPEGAAGTDYSQAMARAQGATDRSVDQVSTASGELDTARYGGVLRARALVGLRGVGFTHDGWYYVRRVTHRIERGSMKQSFELSREGTGALTPVVIP